MTGDLPKRLAAAALLLMMLAMHARTHLAAVWAQSTVVEGTRYYTLADDSMISMRYAQNLAHGRGLVWNVGERVEGVTNLGWTLLMAVVHLLGRPAAENALYLQLANLVIDVALILYVFVAVERRAGAAAGLLAAGLLAANGPLLLWSSWGFETSLQALFYTLGFVPLVFAGDERQQARVFPHTLACIGLAFVVRPDSLALVGVVLALGIWWRVRGTLEQRRLVTGVLLAAAPIAAVLVFQHVYYGAWLPNTFHLKATGGAAQVHRGFRYLADFWNGPFFQAPLLAGSALLAARGLSGKNTRIAAVPHASCVTAWTAYVIAVGGDAFPCSRFFVPIVPLMATATAIFLTRELMPLRRASFRRDLAWKAMALGLVVLLVPYLRRFEPGALALGGRNAGNVEGVRVAVALRDAGLPTDAVTAVYLAGVLPYLLPEYRFHDLLGKSDTRIARTLARPGPPGHNKWDYAYSLGHVRPALVVTAAPYTGASDASMERDARAGVDYGFHSALWIDPLFRDLYRPNRLRLSVDGAPVDEVMWVYARADPRTGRLSLEASFDEAAAPQAAPLASIHRRVAGDISLGRRFDRPSWGLDRTDQGRFAWLGPAGREGLALRLKASARVRASISFEACPGPGRADPLRTIEVTTSSAAGTALAFAGRLSRCEQFAFDVHLENGKNRLRWTIIESADAGVTVPFMASVRRIRVGPPTGSGGRFEYILRAIAGSFSAS